MKKLPIVIITLAILLASSVTSFAQHQTDSAKVVSVNKFERLIPKKKTILIDVRTTEEMNEGHLKGAMNIDFLSDEFLKRIEHLDKSKTYLVYCRSGKRAAKAGAAMKSAGFKKIISLDGGITAWKEHGKTIEE